MRKMLRIEEKGKVKLDRGERQVTIDWRGYGMDQDRLKTGKVVKLIDFPNKN
jgi:hypothetical protein